MLMSVPQATSSMRSRLLPLSGLVCFWKGQPANKNRRAVTSSSFPIPNFYNNRSYTYKHTYTCSYNLLAPVCHEWVVLFPFVKDPVDWERGPGGKGVDQVGRICEINQLWFCPDEINWLKVITMRDTRHPVVLLIQFSSVRFASRSPSFGSWMKTDSCRPDAMVLLSAQKDEEKIIIHHYRIFFF